MLGCFQKSVDRHGNVWKQACFWLLAGGNPLFWLQQRKLNWEKWELIPIKRSSLQFQRAKVKTPGGMSIQQWLGDKKLHTGYPEAIKFSLILQVKNLQLIESVPWENPAVSWPRLVKHVRGQGKQSQISLLLTNNSLFVIPISFHFYTPEVSA